MSPARPADLGRNGSPGSDVQAWRADWTGRAVNVVAHASDGLCCSQRDWIQRGDGSTERPRLAYGTKAMRVRRGLRRGSRTAHLLSHVSSTTLTNGFDARTIHETERNRTLQRVCFAMPCQPWVVVRPSRSRTAMCSQPRGRCCGRVSPPPSASTASAGWLRRTHSVAGGDRRTCVLTRGGANAGLSPSCGEPGRCVGGGDRWLHASIFLPHLVPFFSHEEEEAAFGASGAYACYIYTPVHPPARCYLCCCPSPTAPLFVTPTPSTYATALIPPSLFRKRHAETVGGFGSRHRRRRPPLRLATRTRSRQRRLGAAVRTSPPLRRRKAGYSVASQCLKSTADRRECSWFVLGGQGHFRCCAAGGDEPRAVRVPRPRGASLLVCDLTRS